MVRKGDEVFVVGAFCSHYHGPLAEGLVVGETIRCPWHHACFSLRSGEALRAPAFDALARWRVEQVDGKIFARERVRDAAHRPAPARVPRSVIIVGAGAAGFAAAHTLRAEGYDGAIEMIGADPAEPYDRPNLSKDYLAGTAQPEWLPLRDPAWYRGSADQFASRSPGRAARRFRPQPDARRRRDGFIRRAAAGDRRRSRPPADPRGGSAERLLSAQPRRRRPSDRRLRRRASAPRSSAPASSVSRSRRRCARAGSRSMWLRRKPSPWRASSDPTSAPISASCTRATASSSIWRTRRRRSGRAG